jgi:hypothetical protein
MLTLLKNTQALLPEWSMVLAILLDNQSTPKQNSCSVVTFYVLCHVSSHVTPYVLLH